MALEQARASGLGVAVMQPATAQAASFDLASLDRAFLDDPYPTYRALREHDPVHRMPDGSYFLTRYDDLRRRLSRHRRPGARTRKSSSSRISATACSTSTTPPASCSTIRRSTPACASCSRRRSRRARLSAMQPRIEALVDRLLDAAAERGTHRPDRGFRRRDPGAVDRRLLGIPQDERGPLRDWSLKILGALEPVLSPAAVRRRRHRRRRIQGLSARSRGAPPAGDGPRRAAKSSRP